MVFWFGGEEGESRICNHIKVLLAKHTGIRERGDASSHPAAAHEGALLSEKCPVYARISHQRRALEDSYTADEERA